MTVFCLSLSLCTCFRYLAFYYDFKNKNFWHGFMRDIIYLKSYFEEKDQCSKEYTRLAKRLVKCMYNNRGNGRSLIGEARGRGGGQN